jgi:hypothetical protein
VSNQLSWFPTFATERSREDGARRVVSSKDVRVTVTSSAMVTFLELTPSGESSRVRPCKEISKMAMTFANDTLKMNCMAHTGVMNILTEIRLNASAGTYGTVGPATLDAHARHHHITNRTGIAWVYSGVSNVDQLILALGEKHNRNTGRGDSGYDWDARGQINL